MSSDLKPPSGSSSRPSLPEQPLFPGRQAPTTGERAARNFLSLALPEPINRASRFAAAVVLARGLTLHDYSLVNIGIAAAGLAMTFTTLGLPEIGARDIAIDHGLASWLAGRIVAARAVALLAIIAIALAVGLLVAPSDLPIIIASGAMALSAALSAEWLLRGKERMRQLGLATAAGGVTVLIGSLVVVALTRSAFAALGIFALGEIVASALCWRAARPIQVSPGYAGLTALLRRSWPVALSTIAFQTYYANFDTLIIAATRSTDQAGLYSAAYRVFLTLNVVSIFAAMALLPLLARARHDHDDGLANRILVRSLRPLAGYGLVVVGVTEAFGRPLLTALFGHRFGGMDHVLVALCIGLMWYVLGYPAGYAFIAGNQSRRFLAGAATAAVLDVVLDLSLIPIMGPLGAALAMAIALSAACVVWLYLHGLATGDARWLLLLLFAVSMAAIAAEDVPASNAIIAAATLGLGLALGLSSLRPLLREIAARRSLQSGGTDPG